MDVTHVKRRDAHPAAALESIEGQVAKSRACHVCAITHGPEGSGHGRCAACLSSGCKRQSAIFNCQLLIRKTFAYLTALTFFPLLDCSVPQRNRRPALLNHPL